MAFVRVICAFVVLLIMATAHAQLTPNFYKESCPNLQNLVIDVVAQAVRKEPRMVASLQCLHFHDCFVNVKFILPTLLLLTLYTYIFSSLSCTFYIYFILY